MHSIEQPYRQMVLSGELLVNPLGMTEHAVEDARLAIVPAGCSGWMCDVCRI